MEKVKIKRKKFDFKGEMQKFAQEQNADLRIKNVVEKTPQVNGVVQNIQSVPLIPEIKNVIEKVEKVEDAIESVPKVEKILEKTIDTVVNEEVKTEVDEKKRLNK